MFESIAWACGLGTSAVILYNMLRFFNVKMKYPHDTVSKLNAGLYQIYIIAWTIKNIINYKNINYSIDNSLIGYYLYDTISLLMTPYGRSQYIYFIHHILGIYIINLNITYHCSPLIYSNILYFLMELSACMLNWMKLLNEYYPGDFAKKFQLKTYAVYGATRLFGLPVFIIDYFMNIYQPIWYQRIVISLLLLLYVLSVDWFIKMNRNKQIKPINRDLESVSKSL